MITRHLLLLLLASTPAYAQSAAPEGILLLAHGGAEEWNARVVALAAGIDKTQPVEVAFGMASRPSIQAAVDRLVAGGATAIVAVPLFISPHSSVVTSTEYLLGVRAEMPPDLRRFATMNHGAAGHGTGEHAGHAAAAPAVDNTRPVSSPVPIRMTGALGRHALVGKILIDRARELSRTPEREAVIIVAHGPVKDDENARWLDDMKSLAGQMKTASTFAAIDYMTVRDDAPKALRDHAAGELRAMVEGHSRAGRRVLIVPLLLSYGGIEKGIRQRLEGLDYEMSNRGLMPDPRLAEWVRQSVAK